VLRLGMVVLGVADMRRAVDFWSQALDYRLREGGPGGHWAVQEVERLIALGAERVDWDLYPEDPDFVVLADPEGNRFCVVDTSRGHD
jgi:catechol 2,3-dioxygenase-like lactoylglutathione lyase family enzyme